MISALFHWVHEFIRHKMHFDKIYLTTFKPKKILPCNTSYSQLQPRTTYQNPCKYPYHSTILLKHLIGPLDKSMNKKCIHHKSAMNDKILDNMHSKHDRTIQCREMGLNYISIE